MIPSVTSQMYWPGPSIATSSNIGYYFYVENVGHMDRNYLKKLCFVATVSENKLIFQELRSEDILLTVHESIMITIGSIAALDM